MHALLLAGYMHAYIKHFMSFKPLGFGWGTAGLATCSHLVVAQPSSAFAPFVVVHLVVFLGDHLVSVVVVVAVLVGTPVGWPHTGTPVRCSEAGCSTVEGVASVGFPLAS
ncbi:hypothetical protein Tco_0470312 [Tanacetum coccineum]